MAPPKYPRVNVIICDKILGTSTSGRIKGITMIAIKEIKEESISSQVAEVSKLPARFEVERVFDLSFLRFTLRILDGDSVSSLFRLRKPSINLRKDTKSILK